MLTFNEKIKRLTTDEARVYRAIQTANFDVVVTVGYVADRLESKYNYSWNYVASIMNKLVDDKLLDKKGNSYDLYAV